MRIANVLPLVPMFFLPIGVSLGSASELPRCSANAPCFSIANRLSSAGLAVKSSSVTSVYLNGRLLTEGFAADYHVQNVAHDNLMVIVHMAANMTPKPEIFQVITSIRRATSHN